MYYKACSSACTAFAVLAQDGGRIFRYTILTVGAGAFTQAAEQHGVSSTIPLADRMLLASSQIQNSRLGQWAESVERSQLAGHDILSFVPFADFVVLLVIDQKISCDNIMAVGRDGSTLWTIAELLPPGEEYVALMAGGEGQFQVLSVDGLISTVDAVHRQVVDQVSR